MEKIAKKAESADKKPNEFSAFLQQIVDKAKSKKEPNEDEQMSNESELEPDSEKESENEDQFDIIQMGKVIPEDSSCIKEI